MISKGRATLINFKSLLANDFVEPNNSPKCSSSTVDCFIARRISHITFIFGIKNSDIVPENRLF